MELRQHAFESPVNNETFPVGIKLVSFRMEHEWHPCCSYIRGRQSFQNGDQTTIGSAQDKAPCMNYPSCLWQRFELYKDGKLLEDDSNYIAQKSSLKDRIYKSAAYLDHSGDINYWQPDFRERQLAVSEDGAEAITSQIKPGDPLSTIDIAINGDVTGIGTEFTKHFRVGDLLQVDDDDGGIFIIRVITDDTDMEVNEPASGVAINATADWLRIKFDTKPTLHRNFLEWVWRPTLDIWRERILPAGNYVLKCYPKNDPFYQTTSIQSVDANIITGNAEANIRVRIVEMDLFIASPINPVNPVIESITIDKMGVRRFNVDGQTISSFNASTTVPKSTFVLACAFQDRNASDSTLFPETLFKIRQLDPDDVYSSGELFLSRLNISYNGETKPFPSYNPRWNNDQQYLSRLYHEALQGNSVLTNLPYDREGGYESFQQWIDRGIYTMLPFLKFPRDEIDNEAELVFSFSQDLVNNTCACFLFWFYKKKIMLK